jgi:hypothetical protein
VELNFGAGNKYPRCDIFDPILTGKGVGYAFNSLAMSEIFKSTTNVQVRGIEIVGATLEETQMISSLFCVVKRGFVEPCKNVPL